MSEELKATPPVPTSPSEATISPLPPHHYPLWIKGFAGLLLLAFVFAGMSFPNYFQAAKKLKQARNAYNDAHYDESLQMCESVLTKVPTSEETRILLAKDIFAGKKVDQYKRALDALAGIKLEKLDWESLQSVMPAEFQKYFTPEKN